MINKVCVKCGKIFKGTKRGSSLCPDCSRDEYFRLLKKKKPKEEKKEVD